MPTELNSNYLRVVDVDFPNTEAQENRFLESGNDIDIRLDLYGFLVLLHTSKCIINESKIVFINQAVIRPQNRKT